MDEVKILAKVSEIKFHKLNRQKIASELNVKLKLINCHSINSVKMDPMAYSIQ
jgi:hypothetical protein